MGTKKSSAVPSIASTAVWQFLVFTKAKMSGYGWAPVYMSFFLGWHFLEMQEIDVRGDSYFLSQVRKRHFQFSAACMEIGFGLFAFADPPCRKAFMGGRFLRGAIDRARSLTIYFTTSEKREKCVFYCVGGVLGA